MTKNLYPLKIQQLYHNIAAISKEFQKTPHQIFYDVLDYQQKLRMMENPSTQSNINFFLDLSKRAKEYSEVKK